MNSDQIKGAVKEVAGKVVGNTEQQVQSHTREADGMAQRLVGDEKTFVTNVTHTL